MNKPSFPGKPTWFDGSVIYQIYPRSFQDSNGDGVGDLQGIIDRLDYLNDGKGGGLGITGIWFSSFFPSPMTDFGYDVSNYCDIDPLFGTLADFDRLLEAAHKRGIKIIVELIPNHTSIDHPWFLESRSSKDHPKRDWYFWRDGKEDGTTPNNWLSFFGGSAWEWDKHSQQYYLHSFAVTQPDLNWENPEVQNAMSDVMRFWLERGVDGFRVDAINLMGKELSLADDPINKFYKEGDELYTSLSHTHSRDAGNLNLYLQLLNDVVSEYPERMLVLETWPEKRRQPDFYHSFYRSTKQDNCVPFNLELLFIEWSAVEFQNFINEFQRGLKENNTPVYVLGNHDVRRFASAVGQEAARAGAILLMTLPGLPFLYYGDEIGMENLDMSNDTNRDFFGRDCARSPMQWSNEIHAGFSQQTPWLPVGKTDDKINVEEQSTDKNSLLELYKKLIHMRKTEPVLKRGNYEPGIDFNDPDIMSYFRSFGDERYLIVLNFGARDIVLANCPEGVQLILSTNSERNNFDDTKLDAHEGVILRV